MDLKIKDVAELLNVSETTIRRWLAENKIPAYRLNHQYRFSRTEIEAWVLSQRLGQTTGNPREQQASAGAGGNKQFSLYRALHKGGVAHDVPGSTKKEVLRTTMGLVAKHVDLDADVLTDLLLDRENLQSTGLGNGIAIPHARDYLLDTHNDVVFISFPSQPIDYEALDGKPVHTLFFLFACDDKRHLHLLSKIAHLSSLPETQQFLKSKPSKEALMEYIKNWESTLHKHEEDLADHKA